MAALDDAVHAAVSGKQSPQQALDTAVESGNPLPLGSGSSSNSKHTVVVSNRAVVHQSANF